MNRYNDDYRRRLDYDDDKSKATLSAREASEPLPRNGFVKGTSYLRLRKNPGSNEETLKIIEEGTEVIVLESDERFTPKGFVKVRLPNDKTEYWTKREFIS